MGRLDSDELWDVPWDGRIIHTTADDQWRDRIRAVLFFWAAGLPVAWIMGMNEHSFAVYIALPLVLGSVALGVLWLLDVTSGARRWLSGARRWLSGFRRVP
ncbi:MAG: hypothetical protein NUW22_13780 [Acidobacteria bacterium]|nr:hypothetical protein [Acidobacteriota bacterium]